MRKCTFTKYLALCMAVLLAVACLAGCGNKPAKNPSSNSSNASEPVDPVTPSEPSEVTDPTTPSVPEEPSDVSEPTVPSNSDVAKEPNGNKDDVSGNSPVTSNPSSNTPSTSETPNVPSNPSGDDIPMIVLPEDKEYQANRAYLYGVGYVEDQMYNRVSVDQAVYLIRALGVRSVRVWASCTSDSHTLVNWRVERLHDLVAKLKAVNIQVIFTFYGFESPKKGGLSTWIPRRDMTAGSDYMVTLQNFEDMCYMVTKEFPEVDYWELGNEWNHTGAINPIDWKIDGTGGAPFTLKEKAEITCDLIYRSMRAARRAQNNGTMLFPAMAPADGMDGIAMTDYLEYVYQNIESGAFGSKNPRDFFDALAWHPYISEEPNMAWVENNNRIYQIACDHGDAGISVFLTEFGYPDNQNSRADQVQAQWMVKGYDLVLQYMPYVESMHYYRMFTDTSRGNDYYGLINQPEDGFGTKAKGEAFQKMAGGKGNLNQFYMPLYDDEDE